MTRLADTLAAEQAQSAWRGFDAPGLAPSTSALRMVAAELPGEIRLDDIAEWARPQFEAVASAASVFHMEQFFYGAIVAAMLLGAKLQETNGS